MEEKEKNSEIMRLLGQNLTGRLFIISNTTLKGKNYRQFAPIDKSSGFKYLWYNSSSFQDYIYEIFSKAIPHGINRNMIDKRLTIEEMQRLSKILATEIDSVNKNKDDALDTGKFDLREVNNFLIYNLQNIQDLITNCLATNESVYLSVD